MAVRTHLLTPADRATLGDHGVPSSPHPDYVARLANGTLRFTPRGLQFYEEALRQHNLPAHRLFQVNSTEALRALSLEMKGIRAARLVGELADAQLQGVLPASSLETVDALLQGCDLTFEHAVDRREALSRAGENVVPGYFVQDRTART